MKKQRKGRTWKITFTSTATKRGSSIFFVSSCVRFYYRLPVKQRGCCSVSLRCRRAGYCFPVIDFLSTHARRVLTLFFRDIWTRRLLLSGFRFFNRTAVLNAAPCHGYRVCYADRYGRRRTFLGTRISGGNKTFWKVRKEKEYRFVALKSEVVYCFYALQRWCG